MEAPLLREYLMESPRFKRNVMRTMMPKTIKFGLRNVSRNTVSAQVMYAASELNTAVAGFLIQMRPFLLGNQLNQSFLQQAFLPVGEVCYYTVILARLLKLKVPGAGKKVKLSTLVEKGQCLTKAEAILKLHEWAGLVLGNTEAVYKGESVELELIKVNTTVFMSLLWPLIYELFGVTPSIVFEDVINRLSANFPNGLFSDDAQVAKDALAKMKEDEKAMFDAYKAGAAAKKSLVGGAAEEGDSIQEETLEESDPEGVTEDSTEE